MSWSLPNQATLLSISSYEHYQANDYRDQDFVDIPTIAKAGSSVLSVGNNQFGTYDIRSKTQELRYVSPDSGTLRYVAGLWWAQNNIDRHFIRGYCAAPTVCTAASTSSPTNYYTDIYNVNRALFGQGTWEFYPTYSLVAGIRRNAETSGFNYIRNYYTTQLDRASFVPGPVGVDQFSSSRNKDYATTGKLSIQKQITPEWMVYAMTATGYKGLAYDVTSGLKAAAAFPISPETSRSYELGSKANLFHNRMSVAATLFKTDFKNYQQNVSFVLPNDPTIYTQLNSIPKIATRGFELDTSFLLSADWSVTASYAFTQPEIKNWANGPCYTDNTNPAIGTTGLGVGGSLAGFNTACFPIQKGSTTGVQNLSGGIFPRHAEEQAEHRHELRLPARRRSDGCVRQCQHALPERVPDQHQQRSALAEQRLRDHRPGFRPAREKRRMARQLPRQQPVRPLLYRQRQLQRSDFPHGSDVDLAGNHRQQLGAAARCVPLL